MSINSVLCIQTKKHIVFMKKMIVGLALAIVCALNTRAQGVFSLLNGYQLPKVQYAQVNWVPSEDEDRSVKVVATSYTDTNAMVFFNTHEGTAMASGFNLKAFLVKYGQEMHDPTRYYDIGEEAPLLDEEGHAYRQFDIGDPSKFFLYGGSKVEFDPDHQAHVDVYIQKHTPHVQIALNN